MAFKIIKGWPFGSLELQLYPSADGSTGVGSIATIGATAWALADYAEDGSDAGLQAAFIFDRHDLSGKLLGMVSPAMITIGPAHYAADTYSVGDKLTAAAGKFAKSVGSQPVIASIMGIDALTTNMTVLWYGPNHAQAGVSFADATAEEITALFAGEGDYLKADGTRGLVEDTIVRTFGDQDIEGAKSFSGPVSIGGANRNALIAALESGNDVALSVIGDSTGNDGNEWVRLAATALGQLYPSQAVQYRLWNATRQGFDGFQTVQEGASGLEKIAFSGTSSRARLESTEIPNFTNDLDIRIKLRPNAVPMAATAIILCHFGSADPTRSFVLQLQTMGTIVYTWYPDGLFANAVNNTSTATAAISTTTPLWIRVVHDIDNGAGGNDVKFYTSTNGTTWTQLGDTITREGVAVVPAVTARWDLGSRDTVSPFNGDIYEVELLDGIDAWPPMNAQPLSAWALTNATLQGGPTLKIYNGSVAGAGIAHVDDVTRLPLISAAAYSPLMTFVSLGHNEGATTGSTFLSAYSTLISNLETASPVSDIILLTQNPQTSAATNYLSQHRRRLELISFARKSGYGYIDLFPAFGSDASLMSDTVHPSAAGSAVWRDTVIRWLLNSIP